MLDIEIAARFPWSMSYLQSRVMLAKLHAHAYLPLIGSPYTNQANAASGYWTQKLPHDFQAKGRISKVKGHDGKMSYSCTPTPQG